MTKSRSIVAWKWNCGRGGRVEGLQLSMRKCSRWWIHSLSLLWWWFQRCIHSQHINCILFKYAIYYRSICQKLFIKKAVKIVPLYFAKNMCAIYMVGKRAYTLKKGKRAYTLKNGNRAHFLFSPFPPSLSSSSSSSWAHLQFVIFQKWHVVHVWPD